MVFNANLSSISAISKREQIICRYSIFKVSCDWEMIHVLLNTNSRSLDIIYSVDVKRTNNITLNKMKNKPYHSVGWIIRFFRVHTLSKQWLVLFSIQIFLENEFIIKRIWLYLNYINNIIYMYICTLMKYLRIECNFLLLCVWKRWPKYVLYEAW